MDETLKPSAFAMQSLSRALFFDMSRLHPSAYLPKDISYFQTRLAAEGEKFLCTTLPLLGKAVEQALILEEPLVVPLGWHLEKGTRRPIFLNHLFIEVFDEEGRPLDPTDRSKMAVLLIRQLTLLWSKIESGVDPDLAKRSVSEFKVRTEVARPLKGEHLGYTRELVRRVVDCDLPESLELKEFLKTPWGRHGPGAVADRAAPCEKWDFSRWPGLQEELFLLNDHAKLPSRELAYQPPARVVTVPKDFKGPRVICIEPKENQFAQQGLMDILYRLLSKHPLTKRSISFWNTLPSQDLCYRDNICTIDLKDASDCLSIGLARAVFPRWFFSLVTRYRTRSVSYQDLVWKPKCLATMGNACCFPLQTLTFWAIARSVLYLNKWSDGTRAVDPLRVFGDDIIAPRWAGPLIIKALEGSGFVINKSKTCLHTLVKESCGEWVYAGESQRLVKVKAACVSNVQSWLAYLDYSVQARQLGLVALAAAMETLCANFLPSTSIRRRWNRKLQRLEFLLPTFAMVGRSAELSGYTGLYAWFVRNDTAPFLNGTWKRVKKRWMDRSPRYFNF